MELSSSNILKKIIFFFFFQRKAFLIFSQKKAFLKKSCSEKISYIFSEETFSYISKIIETKTLKNFFHFSQKKAILMFRETKTWKNYISGNVSPQKIPYILVGNFPSSKNEKNLLWKNFLYFSKSNFLTSDLKNLLILQEGLSKPKNQTRSYFLELLTVSTAL